MDFNVKEEPMRLADKLILVGMLTGCGSIVYKDPGSSEGSKTASTKGQGEIASPVTTTPTPAPLAENLNFKGYVSSAFDLTVNDKHYVDSEAFYSSELDDLQSQATAGGYDGWKLSFDAEIGLSDLKNDMTVYVVAGEDKGYAKETRVQGDGTFSVQFPPDGTGVYKVRANKRIGVTLTNPSPKGLTDKQAFWCYNFSAIDQDVQLAQHDLPIILNKFTTTVTKYKCSNSSDTGITIPANPTPAPTAAVTH